MSIGRPGLTLLASATVSRLADAAASIALVLLIIARTHDPRLAGLVVAAFSAGALAGSLLSERLLSWRSPRVVLIGSFGGFGLLLALIAVTPALWLSLVLAAAAGAAEGLCSPHSRCCLRMALFPRCRTSGLFPPSAALTNYSAR
jgi:MFS family permease